ncbi:MAG: hypothetical protein HYU64_18715 [Armatimonadetes bacterium]|nr:hypothetical protein [Armatimonadota bacterium]
MAEKAPFQYHRFARINEALTIGASIFILTGILRSAPRPSLSAIILWAAILLIFTFTYIQIPKLRQEITLMVPALYAGLLHVGPWLSISMLLATVAAAVYRTVTGKKITLIGTLYLIAKDGITLAVTGWVYLATGGRLPFWLWTPEALFPLLSTLGTVLLFDFFFMDVYLNLWENRPPWKLAYHPFSPELLLVPLSPLVILVYENLGKGPLLLFLVPFAATFLFLLGSFRQIQEKDELGALYSFSKKINTSLDLPTILGIIVEKLREAAGSQGTAVLLWMDEPSSGRGKASGVFPSPFPPPDIEISELVSFLSGTKARAVTYEEIPETIRPAFPAQGLQLMILPLSQESRQLGAVIVANPFFLEVQQKFLTIAASQTTTALLNARLYQETKEFARQLEEAYKKLQETQSQLVQSSKMAAVGQLAAGVAHEINNPLGAILASAQMLAMTTEDDEDRDTLKIIVDGAKRCRGITERLLNYSRKSSSTTGLVDLKGVVEDSIALCLHQLTTEQVEVRMEMDGVPPAYSNPQELSQVFMNLLLNSRDAIVEKRKSGSRPTDGWIAIQYEVHENEVRVIMRDNGQGVSPENLPRIFDPFFTTKEIGSGTGLGLSVSQGIVQRQGGRIWAESEPGVGTSILISLPTARAAAPLLPPP